MTAGWYLVHTKTGQEVFAESNLRKQGYATYLPLRHRTVRHARRVRDFIGAYFPGYLFVSLDLASQLWRPINSTFGVVRVVGGIDRPSPAPPGLVDTFRAATDGQGILSLRESWEPGASVQLTSGPFTNQLGIVEGLSGPDRVRMLLSLMNAEIRVSALAATLRRAG